MDEDQEKTLAKLFAKQFIARPDLRARQYPDGHYEPERPSVNRPNLVQQGFSMSALLDHIRGNASYGHYMIGPDDTVKLFALDIDLEKTDDRDPDRPLRLPTSQDESGVWGNFVQSNPRAFWMTRQQGPGRGMIKTQLRMLAHQLARSIQDELQIPVAVTYSGSKGVHVYGFTGPITAALARQGALLALEATERWVLSRGQNIYTYQPPKGTDPDDPFETYEQYSLEVYPKQDSVKDKDLGNLMRLPCGTNLKSPKDRSFFLDLRARMSEFVPRDPIEALTTSDPWR